MGDLTKNISRHEVACKCNKCSFQTIDFEVVQIVQEACTHFEKVLGVDKVFLGINSAARCAIHNKKVGGKPRSQHKFGTAMDIRIHGITPAVLYDYFQNKYPDRLGLGLYGSFVHVDTRKGKARWGA